MRCTFTFEPGTWSSSSAPLACLLLVSVVLVSANANNGQTCLGQSSTLSKYLSLRNNWAQLT